MKKIQIFITAMTLTAVLLSSCALSFPTKEKVALMTGEEATGLLKNRTEKRIHDKWGEPDGLLSGFYGDIYYSGDRCIVIYYDADCKITDVIISGR